MRRLHAAFLCFALVSSVGCASQNERSAQTPTRPGTPAIAQIERQTMSFDTPAWQAIDKLIEEQKLEAARTALIELRTLAAASGNHADWTRALIREVQLATALGGVETAVRDLRRAEWPKDGFSRLLLELYYAGALLEYLEHYGWEINQRERVSAAGETPAPGQGNAEAIDLKLWTREQIVSEAQSALARVWQQREALSGPASLLGPYAKLNNYPAGLRDTLRDVVSYRVLELLTNTGYWRPAQQNEVFRSDHAALLQPGKRALAPDDATQHPLVRALAVLDDLQAWHVVHARPEAAFEAQLERLRRLHAAFTQDSERAQQSAALEALLASQQKLTWWPMGKLLLAEWAREAGELERAHRLAEEGAGAQVQGAVTAPCRLLLAELEAPSFSVQGMLLDGPRKRSLTVLHKNLKQLYFRAYAADLSARLEQSRGWEVMPSTGELRVLMENQAPAVAWSESLPDPGDYASHTTHVTPPLDKLGYYQVFVSARPDFVESANQVVAVPFFVSRLALRHRVEGDVLDVSAFEGDSGLPASGIALTLYGLSYSEKPRVLKTGTTDKQGLARLRARSANSMSSFLLARRGEDAVPVLGNVWLNATSSEDETVSSFIFTDRSVYRPNQTVQWKVLAYKGREASWKNLDGRELTVSLHDANGEQVQTVKVKTNAYGTAAGSFTIPSGRLLGAWALRSSLNGHAALRVEEYKRPTFEVTLQPLETPARLNQPVNLRGEAKYYFGLPVQNGRITWKVEREERYPPWWGWWRPAAPRASQVVAAGTGVVDAQGHFGIAFTPAADPKLKKGVQLSYRVAVDLTDEGGETRSASRAFVLGQVSVNARLDLDVGFVLAGSSAEVALTRTNLDGDPRPGKGRYRVIALRQPDRAVLPADRPRGPEGANGEKPRTPGDELRSRTDPQYDADAEVAGWLDGNELQAAEITTDDKGKARISLPPMAAGAYRIRYETQDEYGEKLEITRDVLVADAQARFALASVLKLEHASVSNPGIARVLAGSGLPDQAFWLEISQDQKLVERRWLPPGGPQLHEIAIGAAQRGGLSVVLVGVHDYQSLEQSAQLFVPWEDRQLAVELSTFRDLLRPGAKEVFRVTVRAGVERSLVAAAELLGYMYDRSLDVFAPHTPPVPLSLYPNRAIGTRSTWGLTGSRSQWVYNQAWFSLPTGLDLQGDSLDFPSPYAYGGPGGRLAYAFGVSTGGRMRGASMVLERALPAPSMAKGSAGDGMARAEAAPAQAQAKSMNAVADQAAVSTQGSVPAAEVRQNFAETAFFAPALITDKQGNASIEFTVPDSVTEWNVWVHAITRDFRSGSVTHKTRSVKDLLVRPYLPRFVRESDEVALKVVVQNAGAQKLDGQLTFEIFDPVTQADLSKEFAVAQTTLPFSVGARDSTNLTIPIRAPRRVGDVAIRVLGQAGEFSDGELRALPLLPSRLHLIQSKFATLRGDGSQRTLALPDLASQADLSRTHEQLVVSVEAQLFMTVLKALPSLIDYPYECSEQTLNRFLSAAIVASVFEKYPAVKRMAQDLSKRRTSLLDKFDAPDPNRTTQLEESPWLEQARGGPELDDRLIKVLDPKLAQRERDRALLRLQKMQTSGGGFPWFPGGPPSPHTTLYLMIGLARASEFDVPVPRDMVVRAWQYLAEHYHSALMEHVKQGDASAELITLMAFAISAVPDPSWLGDAFTERERSDLLQYAFARWTKLPPLLKSVLALSLMRAQRRADASLVFASVMDSAQTTEDEGTFWKPEDRAWLWYNDRIETHALALRTLLELDRAHPKLDGLVVWLLLNKKLNQWKSTRATAEVIYSLVKYLEDRKALGAREVVSVALGRAPAQELVFEPQQYQGKAQIRVPGPEVRGDMSTTVVSKRGPGVAFASLTWHYATDTLPTEGRGDLFEVKRSYFRRESMGSETKLVPLADGASLHAGDEVEVQLEIKARAQAEYIHLRDPRPAGLEPPLTVSRYHYDLGLIYYEEVRDSAHNFFIDWLPAGEYTLKYRLRANLAGQFRVGPASLQSMYAPEFAAFSAGHKLQIQ